MRTHVLKTWPEHFGDLLQGRKTFEIRYNDRGFEMGDLLVLHEWDPVKRQYTGRQQRREVIHVLKGGQFGIDSGHVIMSLRPLSDPPPL